MNRPAIDTNRVLTQGEIEEVWGSTIESILRAPLDGKDVPAELQQLIPYAVIWGFSDDWTREDVLKRTPAPLKKNLRWVVHEFDDRLDAWLAGPEASSANPSDAYVAFSAMRMAADFV